MFSLGFYRFCQIITKGSSYLPFGTYIVIVPNLTDLLFKKKAHKGNESHNDVGGLMAYIDVVKRRLNLIWKNCGSSHIVGIIQLNYLIKLAKILVYIFVFFEKAQPINLVTTKWHKINISYCKTKIEALLSHSNDKQFD